MNTTLPFSPDQKLITHMQSPIGFRMWLGMKLPLAAFAGLRVDDLSGTRCAVSLPYGWRSQNPFQSIYFAAQCMAAELSTGALAMLAIRSSEESVSMLVSNMSAKFTKKATQRTTFVCENGMDIFQAVQETVETGKGITIDVRTIGTMPDGQQVSEFTFQWSFKKRSKR